MNASSVQTVGLDNIGVLRKGESKMPEETRRCPKCDQGLKEGGQFCNNCGTPVGNIEIVAGRTIEKGSLTRKVRFCRECDRNVNIKKDGTCINGHSPESISKLVPISKCPQCSKPYKWKTERTCSACGTKLSKMPFAGGLGFKLGVFFGSRKQTYA
jgi:protein-arginine kinase activator protein McsA